MHTVDILLYVSSSSITGIESMLSEDLKHVIERLNNNFLYLNYSKTKVMFTATHQRLALVDSFTVSARSWVYQVKYLGIMLDPYLSWNAHIDNIGRKISAKLRMLHKAHKVIPRESCLTLYNTMILSIFDYCAVVWDSIRLTKSTSINCIGCCQYCWRLHSLTIADISHFRLA